MNWSILRPLSFSVKCGKLCADFRSYCLLWNYISKAIRDKWSSFFSYLHANVHHYTQETMIFSCYASWIHKTRNCFPVIFRSMRKYPELARWNVPYCWNFRPSLLSLLTGDASLDSSFKEIYAPRVLRVYLATGFDFCEKKLCRRWVLFSTLSLYYEGRGDYFSWNFVYVFKRTTTARHMVSFTDFYFDVLAIFQTRLNFASRVLFIYPCGTQSEPALPLVAQIDFSLKRPCDKKNHFLFFLRFWKCVCLTLDWQNFDLWFLSKSCLLWV